MLKIVLAVLFVAGVYSRPERLTPPKFMLKFGNQKVSFLLDINSPETYILSNKVKGIKDGYDTSKSSSYKDLRTTVNGNFDNILNDHSSQTTGKLSQDEVEASYFGTPRKATFVLVDQINGIPSAAHGNDTVRMGRMGIMAQSSERRTNLGKFIFGDPGRQIGFSAKCDNNNVGPKCLIWYSIDACNRFDAEPKRLMLPVTNHPKNYWQVEATGYRYGSLTSSRNFKVLFSTTHPDFVVPQQLFGRINAQLNLKKVNGEFKFDCSLKSKAEDITLKLKEDITITPSVYIDQLNSECFLRVRPSANNDWVLGYQFTYQYATCFYSVSKGRQIELNKLKKIQE